MAQDAALGGQVIPNGIETAVRFNIWENEDTGIYTPGATAGSPPYIINLGAISGLYALTFNVAFSGTVNYDIGQAIEEGALDFSSPGVVHSAGINAGDNSSATASFSHIKGYPPIWLDAGISTPSSAPSEPTWRFNVSQNSGANKSILFAMVEIYRLGTVSINSSHIES